MPGILNFSTAIAVDKTLGEIHQILSRHGVKRITVGYDKNQKPCALEFVLDTPRGECEFRLPANINGVWKTIIRQNEDGKIPNRFATREQAARVGFRILKDWIAAQTAIIEAGMATMDEIMLPYLLVDADRTMYDEFKDNRHALPPIRVVEG